MSGRVKLVAVSDDASSSSAVFVRRSKGRSGGSSIRSGHKSIIVAPHMSMFAGGGGGCGGCGCHCKKHGKTGETGFTGVTIPPQGGPEGIGGLQETSIGPGSAAQLTLSTGAYVPIILYPFTGTGPDNGVNINPSSGFGGLQSPSNYDGIIRIATVDTIIDQPRDLGPADSPGSLPPPITTGPQLASFYALITETPGSGQEPGDGQSARMWGGQGRIIVTGNGRDPDDGGVIDLYVALSFPSIVPQLGMSSYRNGSLFFNGSVTGAFAFTTATGNTVSHEDIYLSFQPDTSSGALLLIEEDTPRLVIRCRINIMTAASGAPWKLRLMYNYLITESPPRRLTPPLM